MKKIFIPLIIFLSITLLLIGCCTPKKQQRGTADIISGLKAKYAPDTRVAIFSVSSIPFGKKLLIRGEVGNPLAKKELLKAFASTKTKIVDSVVVLPSKELGDKVWGVICISVANMRTNPAESAELSSQVLMGNVVRVWKKKQGWYFIQSPEGYLGWTVDDSYVPCNKKEIESWVAAKKLIVTGLQDRIWEQPSVRSTPVGDIVAGNILKFVSNTGEWQKVELPDSRSGYIQKSSTADFEGWRKSVKATPEGIEKTAKSLLGVPYLWGGASSKSVDCSGFVKTVFMLNGLQMNRDANQQAEQGTVIDPGENFTKLTKGDLIFFGRKATAEIPEKITHVGIYLQKRTFIHSSGMVHINSLDPASPIFDEYRLKTFVRARRILPATPSLAEIPASFGK
jgi:cell wall-associated NlpC family hydrolase